MTVPNFRPPIIEKTQYITPDGVIYDLYDPPNRYVMLYEGDGMPPMDFGTTAGPYQHGASVTEIRLKPRTITAVLRQMACDRDGYWDLRSMLDDMLRPNRTDVNNPSPGVLRRLLSNGNLRDLDCYVSKGPLYKGSPQDGWDEFALSETITFIGENPILYDPAVITGSSSDFSSASPSRTDLVFPFTFPFVFGTIYTTVSKTITIAYTGTWEEYPTIEITGPAKDFTITHRELGDSLSFAGYTIPAGVTVTIDLTYAVKSLLDNTGESWLGRLDEESTLTSFRIECDPLVSGGINHFDIDIQLGDANTRVDMSYKTRYVGI